MSELLQPKLFFTGPPEPETRRHRLDSGVLPGAEALRPAARMAETYQPRGNSIPYSAVEHTPASMSNLLPRTPKNAHMAHSSMAMREVEEFVPTYRVTSEQPRVSPQAVEHQVVNADPLGLDEDPIVEAYTSPDGGESYDLYDGNHRTNAALRRGQLLMPATVLRGPRL